MWILMGLFWIAVIVVAVWAVRHVSGGAGGAGGTGDAGGGEPGGSRALHILEERYARGEIDQAEFEERRRVLQGGLP